MTETRDWPERLTNMHHVVQEWMQRTSGEREPEGSQPGSSLAADDRLFPRHPVSSCVWHGLLTAVEHLSFFHTAFAASRTLYRRPISPCCAPRCWVPRRLCGCWRRPPALSGKSGR